MDEATDSLRKQNKMSPNRMMWREDSIFNYFQSLAKARFFLHLVCREILA